MLANALETEDYIQGKFQAPAVSRPAWLLDPHAVFVGNASLYAFGREKRVHLGGAMGFMFSALLIISTLHEYGICLEADGNRLRVPSYSARSCGNVVKVIHPTQGQ